MDHFVRCAAPMGRQQLKYTFYNLLKRVSRGGGGNYRFGASVPSREELHVQFTGTYLIVEKEENEEKKKKETEKPPFIIGGSPS